jgi:hypothetical protein
MRSAFRLAAFLFLLILISSCKNKKEVYSPDYQYAYAPMDSGHYVIYDVDSIYYPGNGSGINDTVHYQWMQVIGDTFYDNTNDLNRRMVCYRRADANSPWVFNRQWSCKRTTTNYQLNEDDLRYIKLVFPPQLNESWNGNAYIPPSTNPNDPYYIFQNLLWSYFYQTYDVPDTINGMNFAKTLTVNEVTDVNVVQTGIRIEEYALNVGMIRQRWTITNTQSGTGTGGFYVSMRAIAHN